MHRDHLSNPSREFLERVPAAWDETKFIAGYPASHTVIARRKGNEWYVGGLTAQARDFEVALDFLEQGTTYTATIYRDKLEGLELIIETRQVSSSDSLTLKTADRGGFVVHLARGR